MFEAKTKHDKIPKITEETEWKMECGRNREIKTGKVCNVDIRTHSSHSTNNPKHIHTSLYAFLMLCHSRMKGVSSEFRQKKQQKKCDRSKKNSRASIMALGKYSNRRVTFHFFFHVSLTQAWRHFVHTFSLIVICRVFFISTFSGCFPIRLLVAL